MSQAGIVDIEGSHPQIPTSFVTNMGTAIPIGNVLEILGTVVAAHSIPLETTGSGNTVTIVAQYASAAASSVGTNAGFASFSSAQFTVDANGFVSINGSAIGETITGNTGAPLSPTAGNWNIVTANSTPVFAGSGSTLTLDFGLTNLNLGSSQTSITSAQQNVGIGLAVLAALTTGIQNTVVGYGSARLLTTGSNNVCIGDNALGVSPGSTATTRNVCMGTACLQSLTTGGSNTAIGYTTLSLITTGVNNIALGVLSGSHYSAGSESSNICISSNGVTGESNTIRIGTSGSSTGEQNRSFLAGVTGVTVSASAPVAVDTNGQLSSLGFGTSTQLLVSNGAGVSPSWQTISIPTVFPWSNITASQTLLVNNGYFCVSPGGALSLLLPSASSVGNTIRVVLAGATSFTITQNAGQQIQLGNSFTTAGVGGSLASTQQGDSLELVCRTTNLNWVVISSMGNPTIT